MSEATPTSSDLRDWYGDDNWAPGVLWRGLKPLPGYAGEPSAVLVGTQGPEHSVVEVSLRPTGELIIWRALHCERSQIGEYIPEGVGSKKVLESSFILQPTAYFDARNAVVALLASGKVCAERTDELRSAFLSKQSLLWEANVIGLLILHSYDGEEVAGMEIVVSPVEDEPPPFQVWCWGGVKTE